METERRRSWSLTVRVRRQIKIDYQSGQGLGVIAKRYRVSKPYVSMVARAYGAPMRSPAHAIARRKGHTIDHGRLADLVDGKPAP